MNSPATMISLGLLGFMLVMVMEKHTMAGFARFDSGYGNDLVYFPCCWYVFRSLSWRVQEALRGKTQELEQQTQTSKEKDMPNIFLMLCV